MRERENRHIFVKVHVHVIVRIDSANIQFLATVSVLRNLHGQQSINCIDLMEKEIKYTHT